MWTFPAPLRFEIVELFPATCDFNSTFAQNRTSSALSIQLRRPGFFLGGIAARFGLSVEPVLRQNAIVMHSLKKQLSKDRSLGPSLCASVSGP
jgi:hypothetical protein